MQDTTMVDSPRRKAEKSVPRRKAEKSVSATEDIISGLPTNIIHSILERMPMRDAARTSILSRKWRYTWASRPNLVFDKQFYNEILKTYKGLKMWFINKLLMLHWGPILKFNLYIPRSHYTDQKPWIDSWILILSRRGIKELTLDNDGDKPYQLPSYIFSFLELTCLSLCYCVLKSPQVTVVFDYLISIYLKRITFAANPFGTAVVSAPLLQFLAFETCNGIGHFNIQAPKLDVLHVLDSLEVESIRFGRITNLTVLRIELCKELESPLQGGSINMINLFGNLSEIQQFAFDGYFLKFLGAGTVPRRLPIMFKQLKHVQLDNLGFNDVDQISCLICLIRSSPNLQTLEIVKFARAAAIPITTDALKLVSDYVEAQDCMDQTLDQLQTVRIVISKDLSTELLFIKLLLACSPSLEKMIIELMGEFDANEKYEISSQLLCFSRASSRADLIWLDPRDN